MPPLEQQALVENLRIIGVKNKSIKLYSLPYYNDLSLAAIKILNSA